MTLFEIVMSILTAIYVGTTIFYAVTSHRTLKAIEQQGDALMNSQRSWLMVAGIVAPEVTYDWIKEMEFHFRVIGDVPVRVVEAGFRFHLVGARPATSPHVAKDSTEPDLPDLPDYKDQYTAADIPQMGSVLKPAEEFVVYPKLETLFFEPQDIEALNKWQKFACAYGFIKYRDAFNKSKIRETRFCFVYDVPRFGSRSISKESKSHWSVGGPSAYNEAT